MMFNPSRHQVRAFLSDAWAKYRAAQPLSALESLAVNVIAEHPEYHDVLERRDRHLDRDYFPEQGEINPFLHLSMHLSLREQVSIDQPPGVREAHRLLCVKHGSAMAAEHAMMDCLAEMIWQSQRHGMPPDAAAYLACLAAKTGAPAPAG